jgi:hypothetical protein
MNKYYGYDDMFLWDDDLWAKRHGSFIKLVSKILDVKTAGFKAQKAEAASSGKDEELDLKTNSYVYPELVQYWQDRGMSFRLTGQGGSDWICLAPKVLYDRLNKRDDDEPEILVVLEYRDKNDRHRMMQIMEEYKPYTEMVTSEGKIIIYFGFQGISGMTGFVLTNILQEISAFYHVEMTKMFLDVSAIINKGEKLKDIEGIHLRNVNEGIVNNPDSVLTGFGGLQIPVLNISGQWQEPISLTRLVMKVSDETSKPFDSSKIIFSQTGKKMCEGFALEYFYDNPYHPELQKKFDQWGISVDRHEMKGDQWFSVVPRQALKEPGKKLPVMLCLVEVSAVTPHRVLTAFSNYYEYLELAASGDLMLVMFALEDVDSNEKLFDIYRDVLATYPADPSRVHLTGFSHNSQLAIDLAYRHLDLLAGLCVAGHGPGLAHPKYSRDSAKVTDEMLSELKNTDLPTINICGVYENDFYRQDPASERFKNLVDGWQRRLEAHNCRVQSFEEVAAAQSAKDYITHNVCLSSDRSDVELLFGLECFTNDYKNNEGKYHLRLATIGDQCHSYTPQMPYLAWKYLRRFSRDLTTGKIIELY